MPTRPILFYDGQCPLCRKEIAHYQRLDRQQRVDWQDLFVPESSPEHYGLDRIQAMRVIHAVDRQGQLQTGVHAFMLIWREDRKSTRLNSSHVRISYAVFCLKKKNRT